jgi:enterochelin esterase family protein
MAPTFHARILELRWSPCHWFFEVFMKRLRLAVVVFFAIIIEARGADDYQLGPDSQEQAGVPKGQVTKHSWKSTIFEGTVRDYWVYVPAQYDAAKPACVMVFQDGGNYVNEKGQFRVPIVFNNLIHKKEMPVTIGIFINPGSFPATDPAQKPRSNRSFEYDTLSDQYARFLEKEILPEVGKQYSLRKDAAGRAICGISSGGICAFTVAWERPDLFSKVLSHVGSFTTFGAAMSTRAASARRRPSQSAFSYRTAPATWTMRPATGPWPISRWRWRSSLRNMTIGSSTGMAVTTANTAGRYCRIRCGGYGAMRNSTRTSATFSPNTGSITWQSFGEHLNADNLHILNLAEFEQHGIGRDDIVGSG